MKIIKYTFNHGSIAYWVFRDFYINLPDYDDEGFIELMRCSGRGIELTFKIRYKYVDKKSVVELLEYNILSHSYEVAGRSTIHKFIDDLPHNVSVAYVSHDEAFKHRPVDKMLLMQGATYLTQDLYSHLMDNHLLKELNISK